MRSAPIPRRSPTGPFDFEPRVLDFWMEIVRTLSHPHSYAQAVDPDVDAERAWWVGRRRSRGPLHVGADPAVERWLETQSVESLAGFAQRQVDAFYESVAAAADKADALRFVERSHEWHEIVLARELYPDAAPGVPRARHARRARLADRVRPQDRTAPVRARAVDRRRGVRARRDAHRGR